MRTKADILSQRPLRSVDREAIDEIRQTMVGEQAERDPLACRLEAAPLDDEPLTDEEREALRVGREDVAAGRVISLEELRRELESK